MGRECGELDTSYTDHKRMQMHFSKGSASVILSHGICFHVRFTPFKFRSFSLLFTGESSGISTGARRVLTVYAWPLGSKYPHLLPTSVMGQLAKEATDEE